MRIAVVGTGYVGLVTGTCFADSGNDVLCMDVDAGKVERLQRGEVPIFEPGLSELVLRNVQAGRLQFTTSLSAAMQEARLVFLAVGTPSDDVGAADLRVLWSVVDQIAPLLEPDTIVVTKSTVPVGTNARIAARLAELTGRECHVASNPEFLKEGAAIDDFLKPDRVVVGVRSPAVAEVLRELYSPFLRTDKPFLSMSLESAEMTKYAANCMLAMKISFINEMANLGQRLGADINDVRRGIGHDSRIGFAFIFPGVGYGGSCFPKDVRALRHLAEQVGVEPRMLSAIDAVNMAQKTVLHDQIAAHFGDRLRGAKLAIWGLAFKPRTDDVREAPALAMIDRLLADGAQLVVHDPEAMQHVQAQYGDRLQYSRLPYDALNGVDGLVIMTEWKQFQRPDFARMRRVMNSPLVFDGRNIFEPRQMLAAGFAYYSIGRAPVGPSLS